MSRPDTVSTPGAARLAPALRAWAERLRVARPAPLLACLIAVQLAIGAWIALRTPHNGFLWYSGGDSTEYWTEQWSISKGLIPHAVIGYGLPVFYAWVPLVAGQTLLTGLPVIVTLQAFVLVPLGVICFWGVADQLFGRLFAWGATTLYVLGPALLLAGFVGWFDPSFEELFLAPHWYGLTNMADLPTLVTILACAWATLRAYDNRSLDAAVLAGLLGGLAIGLKPSNGFFLPAVFVLLIGGRRWRELVAWGAALVPSLITLTVWKARGLGSVPILAQAGAREALGAGRGMFTGTIAFAGSRYVEFNGHHLHEELQDLREVFWSLRLLEFILVAGILGAIRRWPLKGVFVAVWCIGYLLFKGSTGESQVVAGSYFRLVEAGLPAYALLAASIVFLRPGVRTLSSPLAEATSGDMRSRLRFRHPRAIAVAAFVLGLVPLVTVTAAASPRSAVTVRDNDLANEAPLLDSLHMKATPDGKQVRLSWRAPASGGAELTYFVLRSNSGDGCQSPDTGADVCLLDMDQEVATNETSWTSTPAATTWYRIAVAADYQNDNHGDLMLVSPPVRVRLP